MLNEQMEALARDPQVQRWLTDIGVATDVILALVVVADLFLFYRWLPRLIRRRAQPPESAPESDAKRSSPPDRLRAVDAFVGSQLVLLAASLAAAIPIALTVVVLVATHKMSPGHGVKLPEFERNLMNAPDVKRVFPLALLFSVFVQNAAAVAVTWFFARRAGITLRSLGLRRPTRSEVLIGFGAGVVLMAFANVGETAVDTFIKLIVTSKTYSNLMALTAQLDASATFGMLHGNGSRLALFVGGAIAAPIGEEVFFRGFLFNAFKAKYGLKVAMVGSAFFFAVAHASPVGILIIFPMGLILAYMYQRTGSLAVTIMMHALNNSVGLAVAWYLTAHGK